MNAILERAARTEEQSKANADRAARDLVRAIAHGTADPDIDPTPILEAAGRDAAWLSASVRNLQQRNALRQQIADAKGTATRRAEIMAEMEASAEKLRAEELRHHEFCRPLHFEIQGFNDQLQQVMTWEQELRNSADPQIFKQLQQLESRINQISNRIFQLEHMKGRDSKAALESAMQERSELVRQKNELARRQLED